MLLICGRSGAFMAPEEPEDEDDVLPMVRFATPLRPRAVDAEGIAQPVRTVHPHNGSRDAP